MDRKNSLMFSYVFDHITRIPAEISCTNNFLIFGQKRWNTGAGIWVRQEGASRKHTHTKNFWNKNDKVMITNGIPILLKSNEMVLTIYKTRFVIISKIFWITFQILNCHLIINFCCTPPSISFINISWEQTNLQEK